MIIPHDCKERYCPLDHCMRDPSATGACAGAGHCTCECEACSPTDRMSGESDLPCPSWLQQRLLCTLPDGHEGPHVVTAPEESDRFKMLGSDRVYTKQELANACHLSAVVAMTQLRQQALAALDALFAKNSPHAFSREVHRSLPAIREAIDLATRSIPKDRPETAPGKV